MNYHPFLRFAGVCVVCALGSCNTDSLEPEISPGTGTSVQALAASGDTLTAVADALVKTQAKNLNTGTSTTIPVKITVGQDDTTRGIVKFDQAAIAAAVGSGTLTSASLELQVKESGTDAAGNDIDVYRMLKPWTEAGVTWKCGDDLNTANVGADCPTTKWKMSGADMDAFVATRTARVHLTPGQTGVARFDVTSDVQALLAGASNQGWLVNAASASSRALLWSREASMKPRLVLSVTVHSDVPAQAPDAEPAAYPETELVHGSPELSGTFVRDVLIVLFTPEANQAQRQTAIDQVDGTVIGGTRLTESDGFYIVKIPDTGSETALFNALATLEGIPYVVTAQPEMILDEPSLYLRPNDGIGFLWNEWALAPDSQVDANWALEDIRAPYAWGCSTGETTTPVGVVDLGFFGSNSDLTPLSTFHGGLHPGMDAATHGIRVASVLAATGNNDRGMTGVMWKAGLRLYGIEQVDAQGTLIRHPDGTPVYTSRAVANRLALARREGARVINLSVGKRWTNVIPQSRGDSNFVKRMAAIAAEGIPGASAGAEPLIVIAAGNAQGTPALDAFWAAIPQLVSRFPSQVIVVGASDRTGQHLTASSFRSPLVEVAAPGERVATLTGFGDLPEYSDGTSFAAPFVSGLAGLLLAFDPRLTAAEIKDLIIKGALAGGRKADGIPIIDAYESLRLAAQRDGAPLCGNRVFPVGVTPGAPSSKVLVERADGDETIVAESDPLAFPQLLTFHGGKYIVFDQIYRYRPGVWEFMGDGPTPGNISGSGNSYLATSHERDSTAWTRRSGNDLDIMLGDSLQQNAQVFVTFPATSWAAVAFPPLGDELIVMQQRFASNRYAIDLKAIHLRTKAVRNLGTLPGAHSGFVSISEDGKEFFVNLYTLIPDGFNHSPGPCHRTFRSVADGHVLRDVGDGTHGGYCYGGGTGFGALRRTAGVGQTQ